MSDSEDGEEVSVGFAGDSARLLPRSKQNRSKKSARFIKGNHSLVEENNQEQPPSFQIENINQEETNGSSNSFDVSDAVERIGFGKFQIKLIGIIGFFVIADALEMMLLSILGPTIRCVWHLNAVEEALITTVVFIGMMLGSSFWGWIADSLGRKFTVVLAASWIFYFGFLSAFSPHYYWIIALRCLVGFGIGGAPQATTLLSEFLPLKTRAISILSLSIFWAVGSTFTVAVAMIIMPNLGWRWLLGVLCLPLLFFLMISRLLPESCRFYLTAGEHDKALEVLQSMAKLNNKEMPPGELRDAAQHARGRFSDLFLNGQWKTTGLLWLIWFNLAFSYYGIVLTTTELLQEYGDHTPCDSLNQNEKECTECRLLDMSDYTSMMWTTVAEFPGIILPMIIIDYFGRKKTAAFQFFGTVVCFLLLMLCYGRAFMTVCIFGVRGFIAGAFQTFYVYTPEVYPTVNRALGLGCCSGFARIGAMLTPFVAQVLIKQSVKLALGIYALTSSCSLIAALLLPIETGGRALQDT